jgi:hypothetical protein
MGTKEEIIDAWADKSFRKPIAVFRAGNNIFCYSTDTQQYRRSLKRRGYELIGVYRGARSRDILEDINFVCATRT